MLEHPHKVSSKILLVSTKLAIWSIAACVTLTGHAQYLDEPCIAAGTLTTKTEVLTSQENRINRSNVSFASTIFSRELLSETDTYWLGFQLVDTSIITESDTSASLFYSVPFAIQIDKESGAWLSEIVNAKLKTDDQDRLLAIYRAIHSLPSMILRPGEAKTIEELDSVGAVVTHYESPLSGKVIRSRERYKNYGNAEGEGLIESAKIIKDIAEINERRCGMKSLEGSSIVQLDINGGMIIRTDQKSLLQPIKGATIPSDLRLATLGHDPRSWPLMDIATIYTPPKRKPLANSNEFLKHLNALDLEDIDTDRLAALLFNNDQFLSTIKQELAVYAFSQSFEEELLLQIGLADSQRSRQLLTELISDNLFTPKTRFGSIMALRYTSTKLEPEARDALLSFTLSNLDASDQQLADSTLLTLGSIARNTQDIELESMLIDRLNSAGDTGRAMVAMTALGNTGSEVSAQAIGDYLTSKSSALSARAADALGQIKSETSKQLLANSLKTESRPVVLSKVIAGLGENNLTEADLAQLKTKTSVSEAPIVRRAAVEAISKQASRLPEAKKLLEGLMIETTDRQSLEHIMSGLYGG